MITAWGAFTAHAHASAWEGVILGMITLCATFIWGEIDSLMKKRDVANKFFWELHVRLIQLSYAITVGQNHTLDFKMKFGELIHYDESKNGQVSDMRQGIQLCAW
jgi:hypothetical protein